MLNFHSFQNIHLVGLSSVEGAIMAAFLLQKGFSLTAHDFGSTHTLFSRFQENHVALTQAQQLELWSLLQHPRLILKDSEHYLEAIERADALFVGQNWRNYPQNIPKLPLAQEKGIPFFTLMDLYFEYSPAPICGISGTNGKTTTVNWLSHLLHPSHPHLKGGNDLLSPQCLLSLHTLAPHQLLLLEISNRHLTSLQKTPSLGILTNIAQDHIEEHGGFDAYIQTKYKLVQEMSASQIAILNHEDPLQQILAPRLKAQTYFFGLSPCRGIYAQGDWIYLQLDLKTTARPLLPCKELRLQGTHNLLNGMASALAAFLLGVSETQILQGLRTFSGVRNRLECVASFHSVDYVNDMACTSPHAACAALNHFSRPLLFIAGGDSKGADFESFNTLLAQKAKCLILLPGKLREHLKHPHTFLVSSLKEAVALAKEKACPGDTVLLSPVGTGFFTRFIKGQSSFRNLVKRGFREPSSSASYSSSSHYSS